MVFEEGHLVLEPDVVNLLDDRRRHGKNGPFVARVATACLEIKKKIIPLGVAGAVEGDRAGGSLCLCVGGCVLVEDVDVGTELETKVIEIDGSCAGDDG